MRPVHYLEPRDLQDYLADDRIDRLLSELRTDEDERFVSHRWLQESPAKRLIFDEMYGDLLFEPASERRRILDVGGGFTALSRQLLRKHHYHVIDMFAHDSPEMLQRLRVEEGGQFWTIGDWFDVWPEASFDLIIANDLFPNTDQRLEAFLERALPRCRELRISLTYYNDLRYYIARRLDADEVLCVKAYDGAQTAAILSRFKEQLGPADLQGFLRTNRPSLFPNGRQVALATLRGQGR